MLAELRISCLLTTPLWCGYVPMHLNGTEVLFLRSQYEVKQGAFKQTHSLPDRDVVGLCYTGTLPSLVRSKEENFALTGYLWRQKVLCNSYYTSRVTRLQRLLQLTEQLPLLSAATEANLSWQKVLWLVSRLLVLSEIITLFWKATFSNYFKQESR